MASISRNRRRSAPVTRAYAESLPFPEQSLDAAMAILTVHHWSDLTAGPAELRRVSARRVILTWDPVTEREFWLLREYLPELAEKTAGLTSLDAVVTSLARVGADVSVVPVPIPADCTDGFLGAYWRQTHRYLDPQARAAISAFTHLDRHVLGPALQRLKADITTGRWHHGRKSLLNADTLDLGYRLVTAH
ncbi:class I SAM-dependent methyltransferase [Kribbella sindirgiensis]|uniref:Methyltransferase domain-containing protein n=1 Tax=Kribbella sindirgiensis TaxID=1124744 RepID=A0A4R0IQC5_9ACTN|nr:methyltransferase domain-containing protein [Kribbella sindirgiensis]TCC35209.1 methyltransferase domain-containing protein [Kribbella sindirgiensis]